MATDAREALLNFIRVNPLCLTLHLLWVRFFNFTVQLIELRAQLEKDGVRTIIQWAGKPVHQFEGLGFNDVHLPFTDSLFTRCFLLPMNTSLTDEEVRYICDRVRRFYAG